MVSKFKNIVITGASSGIGRALAIEFSKNSQNLFLSARNLENLEQTKNLCKNINDKINIYTKILDVKNEVDCKNWIDEIEKAFAVDLVIANAGISAGTALGAEEYEQVKNIFDTNLYGVLNILHPIIPYMQARKSGQIAIISSLASFVALPSCPSYSASKSAVRIYGEALYNSLHADNIGVNIICPGYIKTPMTAVNNFKMPFLLEVADAGKIIVKNLEQNKFIIIFPKRLFLAIKILNFLPLKIKNFILRKLPKKPKL
ncbi:MAG: SDR family NAD(P)-dependent oxidoreductase, partial [Alphaproteobacteria bacterium]